MKTKYIIWAVVIIALAVVASVLIRSSNGGQYAQTGSNSNSVESSQAGQSQVPAPQAANVGSVSGVDLNSLGTEGTNSYATVSQDGASDAQSVSTDGSSSNSSLDSVNNPIQ